MRFYRLPKIIGNDKKPPFGAKVNPHHPLSQGFIGVWLFNEGGGSYVFNTLDGYNSLLNGVAWSDEYSLKFGNTVNTNFNTSISPFDLDSSDPRTVYIKIKYFSTPNSTLLGNLMTNTGYKGWEASINGSKFGLFIVNSWGSNALFVAANYTVINNTIYNLVFTYDGSMLAAGVNIYINGIKYAKDTPVEDNLSLTSKSTNAIKYGLRYDTSYYFDGKIYQSYIWNRLLTESEIYSLYANPYQMFIYPVWDAYILPAAAPPPTGGKSIFGYDSIFHAGGIIQT